MTTYRALFANAEFRALFLARLFMMVSAVMSTFALGVVMFDATHSSLLTALAMFGGPLVQLVTAQFLLSASDVFRPRSALVVTAAVGVVVDATQLLPGLPWIVRFALIAVMHVGLAATGGTTVALLSDILPDEAFVLGRATLNLTVSGVQVIGNVLGAILLVWTRPTNIFLISAVAFGLLQTGTMVCQAMGALSIGVLAEFISPAAAITVAAVASLLATSAWGPGLRRSIPAAGTAMV